jgi:NADH:ubiquinone oxidoreductase subunit F (NADH-binding)
MRDHLAGSDASCRRVSCLGYCYESPVALLPDGRPVGVGVADWPEIRNFARVPVVTRRVLAGGAATLAQARKLGVYDALAAALEGTPGKVLAAMEESGQRGRGGAAYPTAWKWQACASASDRRRYVVANGDEGDPGSFLDRILMEEDPHTILEGLAICGFAVGAGEGIVFIRSEYPKAIEVMERAIAEARGAGLIGTNILDQGFDFEVRVVTGMGSYVCGEETALLNAIEGRRGEVRIRPPFPTQCGLYGHPTVINNVETLANVPFILEDGGVAFSSLGTPASRGTKALCLNRGFARPGIVEVEFGTPLRTVIEDLGGGGRHGHKLAAVLLGGPMGSVVMPEQWDTPVCYDAMRSNGIELGHGGLVAVAEDADFRGLLAHWIRFMIEESCGKCVPCRLGSQCAENALRSGRPEAEVRARLLELFAAMEGGSLCAFGQSMPHPMRQLLENFGHRIFGKEGIDWS